MYKLLAVNVERILQQISLCKLEIKLSKFVYLL
jgi:hypothetical protein